MDDPRPPVVLRRRQPYARLWRAVVFMAILAPPAWLVLTAPAESLSSETLFAMVVFGLLLGPVVVGVARRLLERLG